MTNFPVTQSVGTDLVGALNNSKVNEVENKAGIQFLKYDPYTGNWFFGKGNTKITGEQVTVNTQTIGHGWQLWVDQKLADKNFVPFVNDLPIAMEAVRDKKNQLQEPREARILGGMMETDEGEVVFEFTGTSYGVKQAVDTLLNEIKIKSQATAEFLYPEVILTAQEPYENSNKKGEFIHNASFEVVGWRNLAGEFEGDEPELVEAEKVSEEDVKAAEPARRRRKA